MIIRRQLYPNNKVPMKKNHGSGMELKPIYKKLPETQTNSVNKLLHTASVGSKVVQDVDTLLTPINSNQKMREDLQSQAAKERTERNLWRNDEVMEMLYTMQQVKALEKLNDKTVKSENVFKDIEIIMHRNGFKKKSHVQIWTKWKFLKSTYMTSKRNGVIPRIVPPQIYETIHQMVNGLNDSSNSANCSIDGDGSSVSGMVISGVEGGVSNAAASTGEDDDSFGMAHPIFGFRLGMVKSEPVDTGYETVENNESEKDPLENEASTVSQSNKQVKEEQQITGQKINHEPELPVRKVLEIPHRGRGRPPKNPPAASSTPNNTLSPAAKNTQPPPLRVAPFAKTANSANAIAANRPPPPLTMPPTPRIRIANLSDLKNADPVKFAQPKLMPKPTHQQQQPTPTQALRLPKEITLQTRATSTPSPSYPKMKQIPMRKTPYSLRPDRAIPDLEASLSPPLPSSSATEKSANKKFEEVTSTKHLAMQSDSNHMPNNGYRKRRSEWQNSSIPNKQGKYSPNDRDDDSFKPEHQEDGKHYSRVLQNVIIDLSSSLRKMQTQMMRDFFNKQNELLEREHKFQLQQDQMIMKAFQEQTQEIMNSVKDLVGSIKHSRDEQLNVRYEDLREVKSNTPTRIHAMEEELMPPGRHEDNTEGSDDGEHGEQEGEQDDDEEDQQMVDGNDGVYTYNEEEQQNQREQHDGHQRDDHEQEEDMANSNICEDDSEQHEDEVDNQSQSEADHHENGLSEHDFDSNDSDMADHDHVPLHIVSSELNEN